MKCKCAWLGVAVTQVPYGFLYTSNWANYGSSPINPQQMELLFPIEALVARGLLLVLGPAKTEGLEEGRGNTEQLCPRSRPKKMTNLSQLSYFLLFFSLPWQRSKKEWIILLITLFILPFFLLPHLICEWPRLDVTSAGSCVGGLVAFPLLTEITTGKFQAFEGKHLLTELSAMLKQLWNPFWKWMSSRTNRQAGQAGQYLRLSV